MGLATPTPAPKSTAAAEPPGVDGVESSQPTRRLGGKPADRGATAVDLSLPLLNGYRVESEIGRGGMGVVYRAFDERLKRLVAVKMIREEALDGGTTGGPQRFRDEAEAVAQLRHPNIVQIYEVGSFAGRQYLVLEFVAGGTLAQAIGRGLPGPRRAAEIVRDLAGAVAHAHHGGIVHRDLKPGNVLLSDRNLVLGAAAVPGPAPFDIKITDFGLAKRLDAGDDERTRTGVLIGTPSYMAPEQMVGAAATPAIDIYALGAILYELLTGQPPFQGENDFETLVQARSMEPVPPSRRRPGVPADLETICLRCLEKEPRRRYATADQLAEDLERFLDGDPVLARPIGPVAKVGRWAARKPVTAALVLSLAVLVTAIAVGSVYAALLFRRAAADMAASAEAAADARRESERRLIEMNTELGLVAAQRDEPTQAALWFALAASRAEALKEAAPARENRSRVHSWLRRMITPVQALRLPEDGILRSMSIHPGGRHFLARSTTGRVSLGDLETGVFVEFPGGIAATDVAAAQWSGSGEYLAVAAKSGAINLFRFATGERIGGVEFGAAIQSMAFSPDGRFLAAAAAKVQVWDGKTLSPVSSSWPHPCQVRDVVWSPAGDMVVTLDEERRVRLYDAVSKSAEPRAVFPGAFWLDGDDRGPRQQAPAFLPDGLLVRRHAAQLDLWEPKTGALIRSFFAPGRDSILWHEPSIDGKTIAIAGAFGVRFLNVATGQEATDGKAWPTTVVHDNQITAARFAADGGAMITTGLDNVVRIWSMPDGTRQSHPLHLAKVPLAAMFVPNSPLVLTAESDGLIRTWAMPRGDPRDWKQSLSPVGATEIILSPDGSFALPVGHALGTKSNRIVRPIHPTTGEWAGPALDIGDDTARHAAIRRDGKAVAIVASAPVSSDNARFDRMFEPAGGTHRLHLCEPARGRPLLSPVALPAEPRSVCFRPDGNLLAVLTAAGHVLLIDPESCKIIRQWDHGPAARREVSGNQGNGGCRFTADGSLLLTWGIDSSVSIWDTETSERRAVVEAGGPVTQIALSPDSQFLAVAALNRPVAVWHFNGGRPEPASPPLAHPDMVFNVAFHPTDPGILLTACRDRAARLWDWRSGRLAAPAMTHRGEVTDAAFTPAGRVVTTGSDGTARVWEGRTGKPLSPAVRLDQKELSIAVTADGSFALFSGFGTAIHGLSLDDSGPTDVLPADDLLRLGELVSGHRVEGSGVVRYTGAEWYQLFREFRARQPAFDLNYTADERTAWLRGQFELAEHAGQWNAALSYLDRLAAAQPKSTEWRLKRAIALSELKRWPDARAAWEAACVAQPDDPGTWRQRVDQFYKAKLFAEALVASERLVALEPGNSFDRARQGNCLAHRGQFREAAKEYDAAAELGELHHLLDFQHAILKAWVDDVAGYRANCSRLAARAAEDADPRTLHSVTRALVATRESGIDPRLALRWAERVARELPSDYMSQMTFALALARAKHPGEAIAQLERTAKAFPGKTALEWYAEALAHHELGNVEPAQNAIRHGLTWHDAALAGEVNGWDLRQPDVWVVRLELDLLRREVTKLLPVE